MKSDQQQQQPQCDGGQQVVLNPPTDEEIRQFIDYLNGGVINDRRLEYEEERRRRAVDGEEGDYDDAAEEDETAEENGVQKRNRTASMYFYRHHYLSIIQEEEESGDHQAATPASSRCETMVFLPSFILFINPGPLEFYQEIDFKSKIYPTDAMLIKPRVSDKIGIYLQAHLQLRSAGGPDVPQQPGREKGPEGVLGQRALDGLPRLHQFYTVRGGSGGLIDFVSIGNRPAHATLTRPSHNTLTTTATAAATVSERWQLYSRKVRKTSRQICSRLRHAAAD